VVVSNVAFDKAQTEPVFREGDVFVFVNRPPLRTAVQVFRGDDPLMWETPRGDSYPGYNLERRYTTAECEAHAAAMAATSGLVTEKSFDSGGELHVRLRKQQG
jgi:hypothetical protein